jgi:hypothetical protein
MSGAGVKQSPTITDPEILEPGAGVEELEAGRDRVIAWLRLLWSERRFLARAVVAGIIGGLLLAFYLPNEYQASTRLMPPIRNRPRVWR